jgi:hypothetical protein
MIPKRLKPRLHSDLKSRTRIHNSTLAKVKQPRLDIKSQRVYLREKFWSFE